MWTEDFGEVPAGNLKRKRRKQDQSQRKISKPSQVITEPISAEDLVTHSKKVSDVKSCLEQVVASSQILLLTGPAGSAKTTTLKVVAQSLKIEIQEWTNPCDKMEFNQDKDWLDIPFDSGNYTEPKQIDKFEAFAFRGSRYKSLFSVNQRRILLVEDFPNHFIWNPTKFFEFLAKYKNCAKCPIVFIVTDDEKINLGLKLFPNNIRDSYQIINIKFNPISNTGLMKILNQQSGLIDKETLKGIANSCNGDVRTALHNLQMMKVGGRRKKTNPTIDKDVSQEIFQTLGRVLYPKKLETASSTGKKFLYDVFTIASCIDHTGISMLHENFLKTFSSFQDAVDACKLFSDVDLLLNRGDDAREMGAAVCVTGLMLANKSTKKNTFMAMSRSRWSGKPASLILENARPYPEIGLTARVVNLDLVPYMKLLPSCSTIITQKDSSRLLTRSSVSYKAAPIFKAPPPPRPAAIIHDMDSDEEIVIEEFED